MPKYKNFIKQLLIILILIPIINGKSEQGKTDCILNKSLDEVKMERTLFAGSKIFVQINCDQNTKESLTISWKLTERNCWEDIIYDTIPSNNTMASIECISKNKCIKDARIMFEYEKCMTQNAAKTVNSNIINDKPKSSSGNQPAKTDQPIYTLTKDGIYDFILIIKSDPQVDEDFSTNVHIEIKGIHGYLSAPEYPLLPFYGIMCFVYVGYGIVWLGISFFQWRDLLRIQFWIGGVILLGMLEKAVFYAEYQSVNTTGVSVEGAELAAEIVSCAKRTLARMLVIIMSLGFGIVKPRLGPMLHRVVGVGTLYFILASVESYLRVMQAKSDQKHAHELLVASIPLAVLDSGICWWIFTSLVQTTRTLRLRRNTVKLSLYRHFTNTLIFSVMASVIFMLYSIKAHNSQGCSPGWRNIWLDYAYWHILFSILLLVIMILWRPTNNNQRYAFTPLLDNPEDEDEEEEQFVSDAYGVKMRGSHANNSNSKLLSPKATTTEEDDLRWVEENIPSSIQEPALPVLDSDEEIINTKFEVSKMQ